MAHHFILLKNVQRQSPQVFLKPFKLMLITSSLDKMLEKALKELSKTVGLRCL